MNPEALILRRTYPVPVTFADLRRAFFLAVDAYASNAEVRPRIVWHAALKEATGALDEVYAVVDGREVRIAVIDGPETTPPIERGRRGAFCDLLEKADEVGYWQNPREIRLDLQPKIPSIASEDSVVQASMMAAERRVSRG